MTDARRGRPKSVTERALLAKREAYIERATRPGPNLAGMFERNAAALLTLPRAPDIGPGGEVVHEQTASLPGPRFAVRDTLKQGADAIAEDASVRRADLLMQPSFNCAALALDAAESIGAANSLEKMLAHQMAVAHEMALRLADRALSYEHSRASDQVEACRLANATARMMAAFQDGALTLAKLRTGNSQTVTVQHVNVASGGQAIVGNVQTGAADVPRKVRAHARDRGPGAGGGSDAETG